MKEIRIKALDKQLNEVVHLMISGTTGSGKSVFLNKLIYDLMNDYTREELQFIMIDPKQVELGMWNKMPHLMVPVITDMKMAPGILKYLVSLMETRYQDMARRQIKEWDGFQIIVVVDELSDLMMIDRKGIEESLVRLAQKARASGIHLILATQRPSAEVLTGLLRANIPTKLAFRVNSSVDSRIAIGISGAEKISGVGKAIMVDTNNEVKEVKGEYIDDRQIKEFVQSEIGFIA